MNQALDILLAALAGLVAAEPRPGAQAAARALLGVRGAVLPAAAPAPPNAAALDRALAQSTHPLMALLAPVAARLPWMPSELDGRIGPAISTRMMQAELVGPDGLALAADVRVGLWVMEPGLAYPERAHAAEETFHILSGHADWSAGGGPTARRGEGAMIHHPSMTPHANTTTQAPLLALWRWSGEIGFAGYALTG